MGIFNLKPARTRPQARTPEDAACAQTLAAFRTILHAVRALHEEYEGRCTECVEYCNCVILDECTHGNVEYPCRTMILLGAD